MPRDDKEQPAWHALDLKAVCTSLAATDGGLSAPEATLRAVWSEAEARNLLLLVMVLFENFHVANCRSETTSALAMSPLRSPVLVFGVLAALLVHVLSMYLPFFQDILETSSVSPGTWVLAIGVGLTVIPVMELHKWWWKRTNPSVT